MDDADPRLSRLALAYAVLGTAANLTSSIRRRGVSRALVLFALATGLPAVGELLATGPLGLLRHRTRPRPAGVPVAILLGWYCAIAGSLAVAERALDRVSLDDAGRRKVLPPAAALVGTSLDLALDPVGLDAGLWEWNVDGVYAADVEGPNGRRGVPLVNYLGWIALVWIVVYLEGRVFGREACRNSGRLPVLVLLPYYLAAVAWTARRRRFRRLLYSAAFPGALISGTARRG